jgi:hypothetical protein
MVSHANEWATIEERQVAGVWLGAGLLIALATGSAAAGWWLPIGVALAGVLALCTAQREVPARAEPLADGARFAVQLAGVPLFATTFAAYLVPDHRALVAAGFVLVITAMDALGVSLPRLVRAWILGILLVAAAGLVALCLAVAPERGAGGGPGVTGIFAAAAVMFPLLNRRDEKPNWWLAGSVVVALAVSAAALYQLGPIRLGLSGVPVRDLLAAVDGQVIEPLLAGVVVIATVPAALGSLSRARAGLPRQQASVAGGMVAAVGAALLSPTQALLLAAALALAEVLVTSLLTLSVRRRDAPAVLGAALAITLLAWLPPVYLLLAIAVLAVAAVARKSVRTPAQ